MSWKPGPLPPGTWNWGGVCTKETGTGGFFFADFRGDHVVTVPGDKVIKAEDVTYWNNALCLPNGDPDPARVEYEAKQSCPQT